MASKRTYSLSFKLQALDWQKAGRQVYVRLKGDLGMSAPPIALKELLSRFFNEQAMVNLETVIRVIRYSSSQRGGNVHPVAHADL
jgi:hypothetical protein